MRRRLIPIVLSALALAACGGDTDPLPPLAYVPADTPYVMGAIEPIPQAVAAQWLAFGNTLLPVYRDMLDQAITDLDTKPSAETEALALLRGLRGELEGKTDVSQLVEAWGFSLTPLTAFYGIDLVPVLRVELADVDRFAASVARMEAAAGSTLTQAAVGDLQYWSVQPDDAPLQVVFAVQGGQLVAALAPAAADDSVLRRLLGLERPSKSLLDAGTLGALNKRLGFVAYGSGYLDHARMFELMVKPMTGSQGAFLKALKITPPEVSSEACLREGRALAAQWPRTAFGYTRFDAGGYRMRALLEAPSAVMDDLRSVLAPTPGLSEATSALASISFAFKADALPPLAAKWSNAVRSAPWACEQLQSLNEAFSELGDAMQNPAVYAIGPSANAVHLLLSTFDLPSGALASGELPTVEGKLLIGSPNPQGLVALARNFVPQLAEFRLETDAEPVALPTLPDAPVDLQLFGAASGQALGIAIGESQRDSLRAALAVNSAGPQPLLQFNYQGAFYGGLMRVVMEEEAKANPDAPDMSEMFKIYEDMIERVDGQLLFSADGIELTSEYTAPQR
ncbi:MAG: hypothetical protein MEQ07_01580 [Aquimonas sp.]|nr:hypothetical protein [Aquimonas sp.]